MRISVLICGLFFTSAAMAWMVTIGILVRMSKLNPET